MKTTLNSSLYLLDRTRAQVLRQTLAIAPVRSIFVNRALRLYALFVIAFLAAFSLSLAFPLFVLAVGPAVYGLPHLFASLRFVPRLLGENKNRALGVPFKALFVLTFAVGLLRVGTDMGWLNLSFIDRESFWPECAALLISFVGFAWFYRRSVWRAVMGSAVLSCFVYLSWNAPFLTNAVLLLAHNLIAFIYWIAATKTPTEKRVALQATVLFTTATVALLYGAFDSWFKLLAPVQFLDWANLDIQSFGMYLAPWSMSPIFWQRVVTAYAFGQSLHYFVWMKAIPDQSHTHSVPTTFVQSYGLLERDFGKRITKVSLLVCAIGAFSWFLLSYSEARLIYFAVASFHSYFEVAGLPFLNFKTT